MVKKFIIIVCLILPALSLPCFAKNFESDKNNLVSQPTADSSSPSSCSPAWLLALNGSGLAPRKPLSLCSQSAFQNATQKNSLTPTAYREFSLGHIYITYSSASSLKREINSLNREIKSNEYKIRKIKYSKTLTSGEKKTKIGKLESKNKQLKRKISKIKSDYSKAIS